MTNWPGLSALTALPTSSMTPQYSCPIAVGSAMAYEARRRGAVPVVLARLEEHAVARADHLDRRAAPLYEANAFRDVDRLSVRMGVPCSSRARRESDAARAHARWTRRRRDRIDVRRTREPLARPRGGLDRVLGDPHDSTPDVVARLFRGPRQSGLLRATVPQPARHGPRPA